MILQPLVHVVVIGGIVICAVRQVRPGRMAALGRHVRCRQPVAALPAQREASLRAFGMWRNCRSVPALGLQEPTAERASEVQAPSTVDPATGCVAPGLTGGRAARLTSWNLRSSGHVAMRSADEEMELRSHGPDRAFRDHGEGGKAVSQLDLEKDRTPGGPGPGPHRGRISRHLFDRLPPHGRLCRRCREKGRTFVKDAGSLNYREVPPSATPLGRQSVARSCRVADTSGCSPGCRSGQRRCPRR